MKSTPQNKVSEQALGEKAYAGYLAGRLAAVVPAESPLRTMLANRYAAPARQPCEVYTFLVGIHEAGLPVQSPDELLDTVHSHLFAPPARRKRHQDTRWGAMS